MATAAEKAAADKAAAAKLAAEKVAADKAAADKAAADKVAADAEAKRIADEEAAQAAASLAADRDVTVIVALNIGGTRDGEPWPAVGEAITLPAAEAADYLRFGYVREDESAK